MTGESFIINIIKTKFTSEQNIRLYHILRWGPIKKKKYTEMGGGIPRRQI